MKVELTGTEIATWEKKLEETYNMPWRYSYARVGSSGQVYGIFSVRFTDHFGGVTAQCRYSETALYAVEITKPKELLTSFVENFYKCHGTVPWEKGGENE